MKKMNSNCLAGIKCPKCGALAPFCIEARIVVRAYDDGTEHINGADTYWDEDSACVCDACDYSGKVKQFTEGESK